MNDTLTVGQAIAQARSSQTTAREKLDEARAYAQRIREARAAGVEMTSPGLTMSTLGVGGPSPFKSSEMKHSHDLEHAIHRAGTGMDPVDNTSKANLAFKAADIRRQLDEARKLRAKAEGIISTCEKALAQMEGPISAPKTEPEPADLSPDTLATRAQTMATSTGRSYADCWAELRNKVVVKP